MKKMKALKAYKIVDSDGYNYPVTKATLLLLLQEQEQEENEEVVSSEIDITMAGMTDT